jgi:hypothetical protein
VIRCAVLQGWLLALVVLATVSGTVQATQIIISNLDGAGEGFNDTTAVAPAGGNPGTTLGEQRLNVFEQAARIWEAIIDSDVTIVVEAQFNPLYCTSSQAVLGSAGANTAHRNFANAPVGNTWYVQAQANSLAGYDLSSLQADIYAEFNGDIDNNNSCLVNTNWYYGLDGNRPGGTIELLTVVLHEIGHGLGFQTFVNPSNGYRLGANLGGGGGYDDAFMLNLEDHSAGKTWDQLNNAGRQASAVDTNDLHWVGPQVTARISDYSGGIYQGHVSMYAPGTLSPGSSVSHFSNAIAPNELMEPFDTGPKTGPGLALPLLQDIGWPVLANAAPVLAVIGPQQAQDGETIAVGVLVIDNDTPLASVNLSAESSNGAIVPPSGLSFSGTGRQRTLWVTPQTGSSGSVGIDVTASDGAGSATENFVLQVTLNNPPQVTVSSPADNAVFLDTDIVSLQGSASDTEDGDVSASLSWSSDLDGVLGNGPAAVTQFSEGVHTLTVTATDSLGKTGSAIRTVTSYGDSDTDIDGLPDNWEFTSFGSLGQTGSGDFDSDGLSNQEEYDSGATPTDPDSDNDGINDGDEVHLYGFDPTHSDKGDVGPRGTPNGMLDAGDLVVMGRLVSKEIDPSVPESVLADINSDGNIDAADMLLLQQAILSGSPL